MQSIIVFSHVRWNFIRQRPHHLFTRLAKRWRIVFVEEALPNAERCELETFDVAPNVQVWRPHVTGNMADNESAVQELLAGGVREHRVTHYWLWFYTPMSLPHTSRLKPRGIVYDCMDELSHLPGAPRELLQRENQLFKRADLVFAAGRSLYNTKRHRHPDVHLFPGSVDARHFAQASGEHPLHADIPRPRLGYCGVIDERINLQLLDAIAVQRPEWNIVMVGPVVGIDNARLPRRDNVHWLGLQNYADLPRIISGWDVCLLPYMLGEPTKSISPAKTLEYMACARPSVSTSIRDIVEPYGHLVRIADTPEGFIADIEMIMARTPAEQEAHAKQLAAIVARTSWDRTADDMAELISQADDLADSARVFARPKASSQDEHAVPPYIAHAVTGLTASQTAEHGL
ncbi:MAG TPA: glycosyltransferase [Ramlibacter sp.]|nr:glycosyltransferase [Ramlibacter sp.]